MGGERTRTAEGAPAHLGGCDDAFTVPGATADAQAVRCSSSPILFLSLL